MPGTSTSSTRTSERQPSSFTVLLSNSNKPMRVSILLILLTVMILCGQQLDPRKVNPKKGNWEQMVEAEYLYQDKSLPPTLLFVVPAAGLYRIAYTLEARQTCNKAGVTARFVWKDQKGARTTNSKTLSLTVDQRLSDAFMIYAVSQGEIQVETKLSGCPAGYYLYLSVDKPL